MRSGDGTTGRDVGDDVRQIHGLATNRPFKEGIGICASHGDKWCSGQVGLGLIGI